MYRPVPGGSTDPECTHVILTYGEYDSLVMGRARAEGEASEAKRQAAAAIERVKYDAQEQIERNREECRETIGSIKEELEQARKKAEHFEGLNENLRRMAIERANVDRNLRPKKWHSGYVVVSSTEKAHRYKVDRKTWETAMLWETVLETPYSIDFTEEQAREQTKELTGNGGKSAWLVARLGINASYAGEYEEMLEDEEWSAQKKKELNIMLKRRLRANYKTGYWEVIFSHTKPLGVVPADMRAR